MQFDRSIAHYHYQPIHTYTQKDLLHIKSEVVVYFYTVLSKLATRCGCMVAVIVAASVPMHIYSIRLMRLEAL